MILTPLERSGQAPWEKLIENLLSPLSPLVRVEIWWSSMDEIMLHGDSSPDPTWWILGIILTPSKRSDHPPWEMLIKISFRVSLLSSGWWYDKGLWMNYYGDSAKNQTFWSMTRIYNHLRWMAVRNIVRKSPFACLLLSASHQMRF